MIYCRSVFKSLKSGSLSEVSVQKVAGWGSSSPTLAELRFSDSRFPLLPAQIHWALSLGILPLKLSNLSFAPGLAGPHRI